MSLCVGEHYRYNVEYYCITGDCMLNLILELKQETVETVIFQFYFKTIVRQNEVTCSKSANVCIYAVKIFKLRENGIVLAIYNLH